MKTAYRIKLYVLSNAILHDIVCEAIALAKHTGAIVEFTYDEIPVIVNSESNLNDTVSEFVRAMNKTDYKPSTEEYKEAQRLYDVMNKIRTEIEELEDKYDTMESGAYDKFFDYCSDHNIDSEGFE